MHPGHDDDNDDGHDDDGHVIYMMMMMMIFSNKFTHYCLKLCLYMVTKQTVTNRISTGENKPGRNSAHGSTMPQTVARKENGSKELWYTIPCQLQPNNISIISIVLYIPWFGIPGLW